MEDHPGFIPEAELSAEQFAQQVLQDPAEALRQFRELQKQARFNTNPTPSSSVPPIPTPLPPGGLDPASIAAIAQIIAQTIISRQPTPVIQLPASAPTATVPPVRLSEELPDIAEYEGDRDQLDAWEQSLKQRMHMNPDRYPSDAAKISYALR